MITLASIGLKKKMLARQVSGKPYLFYGKADGRDS